MDINSEYIDKNIEVYLKIGCIYEYTKGMKEELSYLKEIQKKLPNNDRLNYVISELSLSVK
ncbi:hypothetical protein [Clostridium polynesiense]|uniref:hypothetical protein n=1 Tax=Clostridium polynesiense TaxID=1325933 RepID=UPI00058D9E42|nr:hypothetical protein [Clostridium polynesiense]